MKIAKSGDGHDGERTVVLFRKGERNGCVFSLILRVLSANLICCYSRFRQSGRQFMDTIDHAPLDSPNALDTPSTLRTTSVKSEPQAEPRTLIAMASAVQRLTPIQLIFG